MNRRIKPLGAIGLLLCTAAAVILFIYLSGRFGGPTLRFTKQYEVSAILPDSKGLAVRSDVLDRGVQVGQIERLALRDGRTYVTFSVQPSVAPLRRDATIQVAEKTLLGESFINLDPGSSRAPALPSGSSLPPAHVLPASVEIDQALNALNPGAIKHLKGVLHVFAAGAAAPATSARVAHTLATLPQLTSQLRQLGDELQGQEGEISSGVLNTQAILSQLAARQQEVSQIVGGGRATLQALSLRSRALSAGVAELPRLLSSARHTLHDVRPLLIEARPLLADLRAAAPTLAVALRQLPPTTSGLNTLLGRLPRFNSAVIPFLAALRPVLVELDPAVVALAPALRNLIPMAQYLSARRSTFAAWFSNTAAMGASGDTKGKFVRFFIFMEPSTAFGSKGGLFQNNPYTGPGDAADNQPYSGYPHLLPYAPGFPRRG
ncbi:MAG TPA: MlaD family protein [Solirubrobacteraceae bacterium]|nr:MlaD family protein [Solirubrobacteraceae bacterium]